MYYVAKTNAVSLFSNNYANCLFSDAVTRYIHVSYQQYPTEV